MIKRYSTNALVRAIHNSPTMATIITTGGGTEAFSLLLSPGGGSATLINGIVPYSMKASKKLIGGKLDKLVGEPAARILAMAAFQNALEFQENTEAHLVGVATTSILQKVPDEREGRMHSIYIAAQTPTATYTWTLDIPPDHDLRTPADNNVIRAFEEHLNAVMVLNALAHVSGGTMIPLNHGLDEMVVFKQSTLGDRYPDAIQALMTGSKVVPAVCFECRVEGINATLHDPAPYILPGSFNPVYDGHIQMSQLVDGNCDFELSIANMDKPRLDLLTIEERLQGFCKMADNGGDEVYYVWVTNAPSFIEKAGLFPRTTFIVGFDTIRRIGDPAYGMDLREVARKFKERRITFRVCGRTDGDTFWNNLNMIAPEIGEFCTLQDGFRNDGSSTAIRAGKTV